MAQLDEYVVQLLHTDEPRKNRLVDLDADNGSKTYYLSLPDCENLSEYVTMAISDRIGKPGNVILRSSALNGNEQVVGRGIRALDWCCGNGEKEVRTLHKFIDGVYKDIKNKGNNPLFLSVGEIRMQARVSSYENKIIRTPVLIYPIKLVRSSSNSPVTIEFIDDEVYINPCLIQKLKDLLIGETDFCFPHPNGELVSADEPVSIDKLGDGNEYYARVAQFVETRSQDENSTFSFTRDTVAIAQYNHDDLCMYYDVKRNREKIENHPEVKRLFTPNETFEPTPDFRVAPRFTLAYDTVQKEMITRVVNGESVIIKGPPGTGKTLTIANMICALLAENKKVLFASKKLAALSEVYKKMPPALQKFALLLDGESESTTAKIKPSQVKRELNDLLRTRSETAPKDAVYAELNQALAKQSTAQRKLDDYEKATFLDKTTGGLSYYDALDISAKYDLPVMEFISPQLASACPREVYLSAKDKAVECGTYFDLITQNRTFKAKTNPFYGIRPTDNAIQIISALAPAGKVAKEIIEILSKMNVDGLATDDIKLADLYAFSYASTTPSDIEKLCSSEQTKALCGRLATALNAYDEVTEKCNLTEEEYQACVVAPNFDAKADKELTVGEIKRISAHHKILTEIKWTKEIFDSLIKLVVDTAIQLDLSQAKLYDAQAVIKKDLTEKEEKAVINAYTALASYQNTELVKAKAFDFRAKIALGQIDKLAILPSFTFGEKVKAVIDYNEYLTAKKQVESNAQGINRIFRGVLSDEQVKVVCTVLGNCEKLGIMPDEYTRKVVEVNGALTGVIDKLRDELTLDKIVSAKQIESKRNDVYAVLDYAKEKGFAVPDDMEKLDYARNLYAYSALIIHCAYNGRVLDDYIKFAKNMQKFGATLRDKIDEFIACNDEFNKKFYQVEFAKRDTTLPLVSRFIEIHSRVDSATDALNFATALENEILPLSKYFTLLDQDEKGKDLTHEERFEHTFYSLASTAVAEAIGKTIGSEIDLDCEMLRDGEDEIEKANIALIENMLLQRIDVRDPDYAFLQGEADDSALRLLFKHHARALLKLKPCMILSPSSVSVLMRPEEFESFDVVIVDEASQLEPVSVLPALFRARKCVIVGDENQMPPISHFRIVEETPDAPLPPSVLALALHNNSFIAQELRCHYRSQTESLIRFSQGRYYGAMKTFPAPVPKTDTLGFNDVYTPQGYCSGGVNQAEANAVIDVIAKHFEKYYVDGVMKRSLAVVAFGESQIDEIKSKAKTDPRLKKFNHDPENEQLGVFYRAVEKVQGQEADDLILSVTYGRDSYGDIYMNFGELNKSVGERIFNVAVTRARQSVTLVHSILPEQFGERNVPFVADYMRTAIRFANGGKDQFVDVPANKGFVRSVADYICSLGFEQDRVVTGYGVTNGSVRIPIAILSEDKEKALCGIWCERDNGNEYDYVDLNVRHYESLIGRDWKLTTVYAHDWKIAREETKQNIKKFINQVLEQIKREQAINKN